MTIYILVSVIQKKCCDVLSVAIQCESLFRRAVNHNGEESYVGVQRFYAFHLLFAIDHVDLGYFDGSGGDCGHALTVNVSSCMS